MFLFWVTPGRVLAGCVLAAIVWLLQGYEPGRPLDDGLGVIPMYKAANPAACL